MRSIARQRHGRKHQSPLHKDQVGVIGDEFVICNQRLKIGGFEFRANPVVIAEQRCQLFEVAGGTKVR